MKTMLISLLFIISIGIMTAQLKKPDKRESRMQAKGVLDFTMNTIDGKPKPLFSYKGNVLMIINTASECGYTPQYETLEKLYETYKDKGFRVLAFPANNFGEQEPGTNAEIKEFCERNYGVSFPMAAKVSVKGADMAPIYKFLTQKTQNGVLDAEIQWNFNKFLIDENGHMVAYFPSKVTPMSEEITSRL